jgi:group I intron endonuclease
MNSYLIYKRTCRTTGLSYVGLTKGLEATRWVQHYKERNRLKHLKLSIAILTYGPNDWNVDILETGLTKKQAEEREMFFIEHFDTYKNGYNSNRGGQIGRQGEEVVVIDLTKQSFTVYPDVWSASDITKVNIWSIRQCLYQPKQFKDYVDNYKFMKKSDFNPDLLTKYVKETVETRDLVYNKMKYGKAKSVEAFYLDDGELIETFATTRDAAKKLNVQATRISMVCRGLSEYSGKLNGRKVGWRYSVQVV